MIESPNVVIGALQENACVCGWARCTTDVVDEGKSHVPSWALRYDILRAQHAESTSSQAREAAHRLLINISAAAIQKSPGQQSKAYKYFMGEAGLRS